MLKRRFLGLSIISWIIIVFAILFVLGFAAGPIGQGILTKFGVNLKFPSWLVVHQPEISLPAEVVFDIGSFPVTNTIVASWLTIIVIGLFFFFASRNMKMVPGRFQALFEFATGSLLSFCQSVAGDKNGRRFFPVVATIFLFVVFNAWLSLLPGFGSITIVGPEGKTVPLLRGANTDFNTPLAIALVSFIFVLYFGLKEFGIGYLKQYVNVGPLFHAFVKFKPMDIFSGVITIFVGIIEFISMLSRIVSFTARLFGNMTAGELLVVIITFLIPWAIVDAVYVLELLVGFVQALIFGGLTLVFLTMATAGHGAEHGSEHGKESH